MYILTYIHAIKLAWTAVGSCRTFMRIFIVPFVLVVSMRVYDWAASIAFVLLGLQKFEKQWQSRL